VASERAGLGQRPERQPIENSGTAGRHRGQYRQSGRTLRDAREGKAASYVGDIHLPTEPPKLLDDAPVIAITSSRDTEITRHGECNAGFIGWKLAHYTDPVDEPPDVLLGPGMSVVPTVRIK
jgi:hypothetical protein